MPYVHFIPGNSLLEGGWSSLEQNLDEPGGVPLKKQRRGDSSSVSCVQTSCSHVKQRRLVKPRRRNGQALTKTSADKMCSSEKVHHRKILPVATFSTSQHFGESMHTATASTSTTSRSFQFQGMNLIAEMRCTKDDMNAWFR